MPSPPHARPNLSPDAPGALRAQGRTPPPAPSAAYARRAREIIEDETGMAPGVIGESSDASASAAAASGGYRRARAGTLPSSLRDLAPQHSSEFEDGIAPPPLPAASTATPVRTSALSPAYIPATTGARPMLRHTTSSAASLETPTRASPDGRLRSGSLTLPQPQSGLANAFGSSWLNPNGRSPLAQTAAEVNPLVAFTSPSDSHGSLATDDLNSTLDYLGLADPPLLPPASMVELRNQAQRAIANHGPASRLRASTVSNFNSPLRPSVTVQPSRDPYASRDLYGAAEELAAEIENLSIYGDTGFAGYGGSQTFPRDAHRPRATTIGALDHLGRRTAPNGYLSSIPQSPPQGHAYATHSAFGYPPRSRDSSRGPRMSISSHTSRTGTPDVDGISGRGGSSTPQVPTRSLWIGNLDVSATSEALLKVFGPYGGIESVRMLPEKTCAFVNFLDRADAIRARDDVLNRLGGHVSALSETAPVRIGFGKIDSAPSTTPAINSSVSSVSAPPPGLVFTNNGPVGAVTVPPQMPNASSLPSPEKGGGDMSGVATGIGESNLPTRALWIGSIPGTTSSGTLLQIFSPFGAVESARVLLHKCCGFINFEHLDSAVAARNALNGRDILGSDVGPIRIGFARVPTKSPTLGTEPPTATSPSADDRTPPASVQPSPKKSLPSNVTAGLATVTGAEAVSTAQQVSAEGGGVENYRSQLVLDLVNRGVHEQVLEKGLAAEGGGVTEQQMIMLVLGEEEEGRAGDEDIKAAAEPRPPATYYTSIPLITDRQARRFDSAKLKDLRKRLDGGALRVEEVDAITNELMEDCAELASDYIGNTVIQKLFERCSPPLRMSMLERIAPHLAMIGIHKNGTWAAQKIIECATTDAEQALITLHLKPYAPPLMCDSLGNYVCAGTLRFAPRWSAYAFDAMMDRMWDVAQNRFGARCMRTCLESPHTTQYQKKRISTGIILNSIPLATNPNGALLLTWLVDQSGLPGRYGLLANRFAPHIAHLCTHKLASLTVLRIITQTLEPPAASTLIRTIFASSGDGTLTEILSDPNNGSQVIGKILAISSLPAEEKTMMVEAVRRVLPGIKASSTPPYRLLLEAVGLPVPAGPIGGSPFGQRPWQGQHQQHLQPGFRQSPTHHHHQQQQQQQQGYYGFAGSPQSNAAHGGYAIPPQLSAASLSPLLIPQNMPLGQASRGGLSPNPNTASPRTPRVGHGGMRGRMSPNSQMMSPGSDPFNPFASPSVDMPYHQAGGMRMPSALGQPPVTFEQQPNVGGLGIMGGQQGNYYSGMQMRPGMFAGAGYQG